VGDFLLLLGAFGGVILDAVFVGAFWGPRQSEPTERSDLLGAGAHQ